MEKGKLSRPSSKASVKRSQSPQSEAEAQLPDITTSELNIRSTSSPRHLIQSPDRLAEVIASSDPTNSNGSNMDASILPPSLQTTTNRNFEPDMSSVGSSEQPRNLEANGVEPTDEDSSKLYVTRANSKFSLEKEYLAQGRDVLPDRRPHLVDAVDGPSPSVNYLRAEIDQISRTSEQAVADYFWHEQPKKSSSRDHRKKKDLQDVDGADFASRFQRKSDLNQPLFAEGGTDYSLPRASEDDYTKVYLASSSKAGDSGQNRSAPEKALQSGDRSQSARGEVATSWSKKDSRRRHRSSEVASRRASMGIDIDPLRRKLHSQKSVDSARQNVVQMLVSGTQDLLTRVSSLIPVLRSFSRRSSDSGFLSATSLPPSRPLSGRGSFFSILSATASEAGSEDDEEFISHVKLVPGGIITDDYTMLELLGEGAFSKVFLAESKAEKGGLAAVKVINKVELNKEEDKMFLVEKEIEIMSRLDHPNIVKLFEVYVNESEVCLVMELAKGGELFDKLIEFGSLTEQDAAKHLVQILSAVEYLHSLGIVHRDLKPENILYYDNKSNSKVMVTDFGLSEYEEELSPESPVCGTATYMSPEVVNRTASTRAQDMWSLGVISYIILCGYPPFFKDSNDKSETELLKQISRGKYKFHSNFWDDISVEAKDFVGGLMCVNPAKRMTVREALDHRWIKSSTRGKFTESIFQSFIQAAAIIGFAIFVLHIYFSVLSTYFSVDYTSVVTELTGSLQDYMTSAGELASKSVSSMAALWPVVKDVVRTADFNWLMSTMTNGLLRWFE